MEARESTAAEVQAQTGATFIPPYNYGPTICGQGTMTLEFLQQACPCTMPLHGLDLNVLAEKIEEAHAA